MTFSYQRGPRNRPAPNKSPEADLQRAVVTYLEFALPDAYRFRAGMEGVRLSKFQAAKSKSLGTRKGWPDIEIKNKATGAIWWIELKAATGSLSVEQREFRDECPQVWALARSLEEVEAALIRFGIAPRVAIGNANRYGA